MKARATEVAQSGTATVFHPSRPGLNPDSSSPLAFHLKP